MRYCYFIAVKKIARNLFPALLIFVMVAGIPAVAEDKKGSPPARISEKMIFAGKTDSIKNIYMNFERLKKSSTGNADAQGNMFSAFFADLLPIELLGGCAYKRDVKLIGLRPQGGATSLVYILPVDSYDDFLKDCAKYYKVKTVSGTHAKLSKRAVIQKLKVKEIAQSEEKDITYHVISCGDVVVVAESEDDAAAVAGWKERDQFIEASLASPDGGPSGRSMIELCVLVEPLLTYAKKSFAEWRTDIKGLEKEFFRGSGLTRFVTWVLDGQYSFISDIKDARLLVRFGRLGISTEMLVLPKPDSELAKLRAKMDEKGRQLEKSNISFIPSNAFLAGTMCLQGGNSQRALKFISQFLKISTPRGAKQDIENFHRLLGPFLTAGEGDFTFAFMTSGAVRKFELQFVMIFDTDAPEKVPALAEEYAKKIGCAPFLDGGGAVDFYKNSSKYKGTDIHEMSEKNFNLEKIEPDQADLLQAIYGIGAAPSYYIACEGKKVIIVTGSNGLDLMREMIDAVKDGKPKKPLISSARFQSAFEQVPMRGDMLVYFGPIDLLRTVAEFGRNIAGEQLGNEIPVLAPTMSGLGLAIKSGDNGTVRVITFLPARQISEILKVLESAGGIVKWKDKKSN